MVGIADSKKLREPQREWLYEQLTQHPHVQWSVGEADERCIAEKNILRATDEAMDQAVRGLNGKCPHGLGQVLVDGSHLPPQLADFSCRAVVRGDNCLFAVAAASIIAKVTRDRLMSELDRRYPQYGFRNHKGYGTPRHREALVRHGCIPAHRKEFEPIKTYYKTGTWRFLSTRACSCAARAHWRSTSGATDIDRPRLQ